MGNGTPGSAGMAWIVAAILAVATIITIVSHSFGHWLFVALGLIVGLMAVRSIG